MENPTHVIEYKCPCCDAALIFGEDSQQMRCEYCNNTFDIDTVRAFNEEASRNSTEDFQTAEEPSQQWSEEEQSHIRAFVCPACGGEIVTDENTAATFCPYCSNPTIMPSRVSGGLKPDGVIPFKTGKEDAKAAFLNLCKGKPLLPGFFTQEQQVEKITGIYVPFWLYDCSGDLDASYKATRISSWVDPQYTYTKTDHFLLRRAADAQFEGIPVDGSSKMDDSFMESIEPYDYSQMEPFDTAYLSGFLADKYDVKSENGHERVRQRVEQSLQDQVGGSLLGYATVVPTSRQINITHGMAKYVLLPVWLLNIRYQDKLYTFAMNGQTGKMTGSFPVCPKRTAAWFAGIFAGTALLTTLIQLML